MKLLALVVFTFLSIGIWATNPPNYTVKYVGEVTQEQKAKVDDALKIAHEKLRSPEFRTEVLGFKMPDGKEQFYQTSRTNEEVYKVLVSNNWDHQVSFYSSCFSSARAYVQGSPIVFLNWCKIRHDPLYMIANTLIHEQTHVFGFTHDYQRTELRAYSVPYGVGSIIEGLTGGEKDIKPHYVPWYKKVWNWMKG